MSALSSQACCGIDRYKCVALSCPVGVTIGEFCWYFYPLEGWETLKRWNLCAAAGWLLQQQSQHKLTELVSRAERCWGNGRLTSPFHHLSMLLSHFCLLCRRSSAEAPVMGSHTASWALKRLTGTLNSVFQFSGKWGELVGFFQLLRKIWVVRKRTTNSTHYAASRPHR